MRDIVFVFARAPRLGTVKRRLARTIGDRAALDFHRRTLARVLRDLARDRRFATMLAATPDRAAARWPVRVPIVWQGHGDLGQRMQRLMDRCRHGRAVIVGCDIPDLTANDVAGAFRALDRADAVFGPATDGGYWLVGFGPRRRAGAFAGVRWSSAHALADTLANLPGLRVARLRTLSDVDEAADLTPRPSGAPATGA